MGGVDERNIALDYTPYKLIIPPGALENLHATGFDLLSLANNHSLDAGIAGLQETISGLKASGIEPLGVSPAPTIHDAGSFRIAFLALNLIPGGIVSDIVAAQEMVQDAREQADVVIVSIHWGLEYHLEPSPAQAQLAKQLSQAGADLVLGHHPHVVQPIEILSREEGDSQHDTFVAYSLGNFVFDQFDEHTNEGLALRILVDQDGLRAVQALPVEAGPRPRLASLQESNALLARVSPPPRRVGYACDVRECWSIPVPQEERTGIFWTGEIDLTGDGVPETIRRSAQSVTIYQDGKAVWRSPPEWRVLDVAMGDPNDDGRAEVLLALNKPGREGNTHQSPVHPGLPRRDLPRAVGRFGSQRSPAGGRIGRPGWRCRPGADRAGKTPRRERTDCVGVALAWMGLQPAVAQPGRVIPGCDPAARGNGGITQNQHGGSGTN